MSEIVGACLSQFHDDENSFELLLAYSDGREIGSTVSRAVAQKMAAEIVANAGGEYAAFSDLLDALRNVTADTDAGAELTYRRGGMPVSGYSLSMFLNTKDMLGAINDEIAKIREENKQLREELACTIEELIDHCGDDMDDTRARRVAELRSAIGATSPSTPDMEEVSHG